jgi:hypothetical protein
VTWISQNALDRKEKKKGEELYGFFCDDGEMVFLDLGSGGVSSKKGSGVPAAGTLGTPPRGLEDGLSADLDTRHRSCEKRKNARAHARTHTREGFSFNMFFQEIRRDRDK